MTYWQVALGLSCIAAGFILWPLVGHWLHRDEQKNAQARTAANARLYEEHLVELEQLREIGDLNADEFAALKVEQQRALLEDASDYRGNGYRRGGFALLIGAALMVPLFAWVMHEQLGAKDDWDIYEAVKSWQSGERQEPEFTVKLRNDLSHRLEERPENTQNWYLLATLAMDAQDYDQAVAAYRQIIALEPESPFIMAELAQSLFLQAGNRITPEVRENTQRALEINPDMPTALGLAGIDAFQQGYFQTAIDSWSHAVNLLGAEAPGAKALISGIARARAELATNGKVLPVETDKQAAQTDADLIVEVSLAKGVKVDPSATVFVYARAFKGPRMPLAIQRFSAKDLPKTVSLDESMSMAPGMSLSKFDQVEVVARISASGNAIPVSGDWQASEGPVTLGDEPSRLELIIAEQIP
jgi:cytochrome c-type biogenesis protein CcmH